MFTKVLIPSIFFLVLVTSTMARTCAGGFIESTYPNGRCAMQCDGFSCGCDDTSSILGGVLEKSACITLFEYNDRSDC